ncbi:MAG: hypothetical protein HC919_03150 [Oscillatoriales cyanobacterium SM2_2_1]|nr:hypothetical protein [Oscillatoriales cyanobacterium SM2_2_1]
MRLDNQDKTVFILVLFAAIAVSGARLLSPMIIGWDQGIQLEAAYRLLGGEGLKTVHIGSANFDIYQSPEARYLTHFPPTYSLLMAALMSWGLPLIAALKIFYTAVTIAGWGGWGLVLAESLGRPLRFGTVIIRSNVLLALSLPFFFTPVWQGTDIILWAAVPFWIWFISRQGALALAISGGIMGLLVTVRYTSIYLAAAAFFGLFQCYEYNWKRSLRQFSIYMGGACLFLIPLLLYNRWALQNSILPPAYAGMEGLWDISSTLTRIVSSFSATSYQFGLPLISSRLLPAIAERGVLNITFGLGCIVVFVALPFVVARTIPISDSALRSHLSLWLAWLPISAVLLLTAAMFSNRFNFLAETRYYWPTQFIFLALLYGWLSQESYALARINTGSGIKLGMLTLILLYQLTYRPFLLVTGDDRFRSAQLLGIDHLPTATYPSQQVFGSGLRQEVADKLTTLASTTPQPIIFLQNYSVFAYGTKDSWVYRPIDSNSYWQEATTSQAVNLYFVTFSRRCPRVCDTASDQQVLNAAPLELIFTESYDQDPNTFVRIYRWAVSASTKIKDFTTT